MSKRNVTDIVNDAEKTLKDFDRQMFWMTLFFGVNAIFGLVRVFTS
jgi:hypothetical protein